MRSFFPPTLLTSFKLLFPFSSSSFPTAQLNPTSSGRFIQDHPIFFLLQQARCLPDPRILHTCVVVSGLIHDSFAVSRLVQFFLRPEASDLRYASAIFLSLCHPDVYTWNAIILGQTELGSPESAVSFYFRMRATDSPPNLYTFALLVKACQDHRDGNDSVLLGKKIHGQVMKTGAEDFIVVKNSLLSMYCNLGLLDDARLLFDGNFCRDLISWNVLISAYGKNGDKMTARSLFDKMPQRNLVSWSALLDGYVWSGDCRGALRLFDRLLAEGIKPDVITMVTVLKACACCGALDQGRWIHLYIKHNKLCSDNNLILSTALVDMYCRCGCVDAAFDVFDKMADSGDAALWNAMIGGLSMHGHGHQAVDLFTRMTEKGLAPTEATYVTVLCACSRAGMVDEGVKIFETMEAHGVQPQREHYGCLADLMGRAGKVHKAEEILLGMPMEPQASQWGALMAACRTHKEVEVGERVGKQLIELEPGDGGRYVMLANTYAEAGRWKEVIDARRKMDDRGVKKEAGWSLIEWNGTVL
ncbi:hypothetical protein HPP92_018651 [Vanilla planifolia]|uniref:Pentatricopeptide repeat-containing protein n=1 Tax=Vanilla planifolia TaxID=51239 RepID=A0A835QA99_VANPL|nr:hypothetical protein HPP92_018651 [Vanilla planifolia]